MRDPAEPGATTEGPGAQDPVGAGPSGLPRDLATRVTALLGDPVPVLPTDIRSEPVPTAQIERNVRAAAARFGKGTLGRPVAGDGTTTSSWAIEGERGALELDDQARNSRRRSDRARARAVVDGAAPSD